MKRLSTTRNTLRWLPPLGLAFLWLMAVVLVDPRGDFPLVDDFSYGRSVKTLLEQHRLEYDGWVVPTLFTQVLWGALFCTPFGFSFTALRVSTLIAALAGGLGVYALVRQVAPAEVWRRLPHLC